MRNRSGFSLRSAQTQKRHERAKSQRFRRGYEQQRVPKTRAESGFLLHSRIQTVEACVVGQDGIVKHILFNRLSALLRELIPHLDRLEHSLPES